MVHVHVHVVQEVSAQAPKAIVQEAYGTRNKAVSEPSGPGPQAAVPLVK